MPKPIELINNGVGGVDLITERDAGNKIRILTGKPQFSKDFWRRIRVASLQALKMISEMEKGTG